MTEQEKNLLIAELREEGLELGLAADELPEPDIAHMVLDWRKG